MLRQKSEPMNEEVEHVTIRLNRPFFLIKGKEQAFIDECNNIFENGICETVWEGSINVDVKNTRKNFLDNVDFLHFPNSLGKVPIAQVEEYTNNVIDKRAVADQRKLNLEPVCECLKYRLSTIRNYQEAWKAITLNAHIEVWDGEICKSENEHPGYFGDCKQSSYNDCESRKTFWGHQFCKWSQLDLTDMIMEISPSDTSCDTINCENKSLFVQKQNDGKTSKMIPNMCPIGKGSTNELEKEGCEIQHCCQHRKCLLFFDEVGTYCSDTGKGGRTGYWCSHYANSHKLPAGTGICRPESNKQYGSECQDSALGDMREKLAEWGLLVPLCSGGLKCNTKGTCDIECACYHFKLEEQTCRFDKDPTHEYEQSVCEYLKSCGSSSITYGYGAASRFTDLQIEDKSPVCIYESVLTVDENQKPIEHEQEWDISYFFQILDQRKTVKLPVLEQVVKGVDIAFAAWNKLKDVGGAWFNLMYEKVKGEKPKEKDKDKDKDKKESKEKENEKSSDEKEVSKDTSKANGFVKDLINSGIELAKEFVICMSSPTLLLDRMIRKIKVEHYYKYGFVRDYAMYTYVDSLSELTGGVGDFIHRWWPTVSFCLVPIMKNLIDKVFLRLASLTIGEATGKNALVETVIQTIFMFAVGKNDFQKEVEYAADKSDVTNTLALEALDGEEINGLTFPECEVCNKVMKKMENAAMLFANFLKFAMKLLTDFKALGKAILDYIDILFLWLGYYAYCDARMRNISKVFLVQIPKTGSCIEFKDIDARYVKMNDKDGPEDEIKEALAQIQKAVVEFHEENMKIQWF